MWPFIRVGKEFVVLLIALPGWISAQTDGAADRADPNAAPPTATTPAPAFAGPTYTPMTGDQRWKTYLVNLFGPVGFACAGAGAGIGQWMDRPKEWKEGWGGYGSRFLSAYGEHIVRETLAFGIAGALHEDNRYFASGQSGFGARLKYAVDSAWMTRRRDGTRHVSISRLVSLAGAAVISRRWQPPSTNNYRCAGGNFATALGVNIGFNVVREFLPGVFHTRK
jgi:hypothetical protein